MSRGLSSYGRSISPNHVDDIISNTSSTTVKVDDVFRQVYRSGSVQVVTEADIVVTVNPFR